MVVLLENSGDHHQGQQDACPGNNKDIMAIHQAC